MINNSHQRELPVPPERLGLLLDRAGTPSDVLWPAENWSPMTLDRAPEVGATGGHGPIRYSVTAYQPGRRIEFTFDPARGVVGTHTLEIIDGADGGSVLRHVLTARLQGRMRLVWPFAMRWLHDAVVEELLDHAATEVGHPPAHPYRWSLWVRLIRRLTGLPASPAQPRQHTDPPRVQTSDAAPGRPERGAPTE